MRETVKSKLEERVEELERLLKNIQAVLAKQGIK